MGEPCLVILAAGMGSRFGGLKQITAVDDHGHAIIDFSLYDAYQAGFRKVVFIIKHAIEDDFRAAVADRMRKYFDVRLVFQELDKLPAGFSVPEGRVKPWGTAHAVLMARDVIREPFLVINGDDFYGAESFRIAADWCRAHENTRGQYAIIGFELDNTLSENGTVSRGICHYDDARQLSAIEEHLCIAAEADGNVYGDNSASGQKHVQLDPKALCSMNMWGFTPDYFEASEAVFTEFLKQNIGELKKEFYIPFAVDSMIKAGCASCEVIGTPSHWFGVTYKEDRPAVVAKFAELVKEGVYPSPLY